MNNKKAVALLSKNPTFDLGFISKEFQSPAKVDSYFQNVRQLTKNLSSRKISSSVQEIFKRKSPVQFSSVKTQSVEPSGKRVSSLPKLKKGQSYKSLQKKYKNEYQQLEQKYVQRNKIIRNSINKKLKIMQTSRSPFCIKKYGSWFD